MRLLFILSLSVLIHACGPLEKESVKPIAKVQTLAEVLGTGNLSPAIDLTFKFEDIN